MTAPPQSLKSSSARQQAPRGIDVHLLDHRTLEPLGAAGRRHHQTLGTGDFGLGRGECGVAAGDLVRMDQ